jgi:MYXO-CTERM domain-containing protein
VVGNNTHNIGRADTLNIYDASQALVDRLAYGDQVFPGTIRAMSFSGIPSTLDALGANNVALWKLASIGDGAGSYASLEGNVGNPGIAPAAEPATAGLVLLGLTLLAAHRRRRSS